MSPDCKWGMWHQGPKNSDRDHNGLIGVCADDVQVYDDATREYDYDDDETFSFIHLTHIKI